MDNRLVIIFVLYLYIRIIARTTTKPESFTQVQKALETIKAEVLNMYEGLRVPDHPEERCFPVHGHIGTIINRATSFCG